MSKQIQPSMTLYIALAVVVAALTVSLMHRQGAAQSSKSGHSQPKKLREIAMERDVEVEGTSGCDLAEMTLADLSGSSSAIVYGQIIDSKSFFDKSGAPMESGEVITTEYMVDVKRVLKDTTLETVPPLDKSSRAPLSTPLKIARNGGVVYVTLTAHL
jgi:hypothetical protein